MILFFNIAMSIGFIMMSILVLAHQTMFKYIFKKLKKAKPVFLKSKIDKYAYFDERTQFAFAVLKGEYKELDDRVISKLLNKQRAVMLLCGSVFVFTIICFNVAIILQTAR